jgi:RNA polymerase sigma factor (sigma-70 family)
MKDNLRLVPSLHSRELMYRELQPVVFRLIRQYGDTTEMRQDLNGELYYRFCSMLDNFDPGRGIPLRPYLVRNLTTSAYSFARRYWHRRSRELSFEQDVESIEPLSGREDPTNKWLDDMEARKVFRCVFHAIDRLPPRQRAVVVGRYLESRTFSEMALHLGIRETSVRSTLRHGLCNLRRRLTPERTPL